MPKYLKWGLPLLIVLGLLLYTYDWTSSDAELNDALPLGQPVSLQLKVATTPALPITQRLGLNLSAWSAHGAEQYMRNVIKNPGFEGQIDRILVVVQRSDENSFSDNGGLGQPDGFWKGAQYEVRSGASAGLTGTLRDSKLAGTRGLAEYYSENKLPPLAENDVVALTKISHPNPVGQWWIAPASQELVHVDTQHPYPGSGGTSSLALSPSEEQAAEVGFYLDMLTEQCGKLLVCKGPWRLSLRIAAQGENAKLQASFKRLGDGTSFLEKEFKPIAASSDSISSQDWQLVEVEFTPEDKGSAAPLQLLLSASTPHTTIYIDDITLGPVQSATDSVWRQEVVDQIKALRPAYLRDWQGQLADTVSNRLAPPFARATHTLQSAGKVENLYSYSIPEFLALAHEVQANPWLILPPTAGDAELRQLGRYLADHADQTQFSDVIVEFGNENWNGNYRSEGLADPSTHGPVSERAFRILAEAAGPQVHLRKLINAQFENPWQVGQFAQSTFNADLIGIAPYFFNEMIHGTASQDNLKALFAIREPLYQQIRQEVKKNNKSLASTSINLHTITGNASQAEREHIVPSAAAGSALAKHVLVAMVNQVAPQCLYCFSQISTPTSETPGEVHLWGITRDLGPTQRLRPTGLAMKMLNEVIAGSLHNAFAQPNEVGKIPTESQDLTVATFRTADQWSAALVNGNAVALEIQLQFPEDGRALPSHAQALDAPSPFANNEKEELVKIADHSLETSGRILHVTVPAYGLVILKGDQKGTEET